VFHIFIIVFLFDFFPDYVMVNSLTKCVLEFSWGLVWVALQCFLNSDGVQNLIENAMDVGFMGPNYSISNACATSNYCFYAAANHIRRGEADIIIAGGTAAAIIPIGLGGFVACVLVCVVTTKFLLLKYSLNVLSICMIFVISINVCCLLSVSFHVAPHHECDHCFEQTTKSFDCVT